jgi:hypothetical protein
MNVEDQVYNSRSLDIILWLRPAASTSKVENLPERRQPRSIMPWYTCSEKVYAHSLVLRYRLLMHTVHEILMASSAVERQLVASVDR